MTITSKDLSKGGGLTGVARKEAEKKAKEEAEKAAEKKKAEEEAAR